MTDTRRWNGRDWGLLALLGLLVILFHWPLLTPNPADRMSYPPGDFTAQFWAFSTFEFRELGAGRWPLWNPYTYAGAPFWADVQSAVLYPFSLLNIGLNLLLRADFSLFALELEAIAHFWLAGTWMYLFVRRITQSRLAGWWSAIIFAFSGYLTGYPAQQLAVLQVDVWLPLILFFIDRALVRRTPSSMTLGPVRWSALLGAGVAWGIALLAGHPQSWMLVGYTFALYSLFLVWQFPPRPNGWSRLGYGLGVTAVPVLVGLGLAAVQFLPALEYTQLSVRATGTFDKMSGGFPLTDLVQVLLPGIVSQYSPLYVGVAGLMTVWVALFFRPTRFTTFWGVWGGLALLISFGGHTFMYAPLYLFGPGFSMFRGQERWGFVVAFSLAVLAGYGLQRLLTVAHTKNHVWPTLKRATVGLLLATVGLVIAFFYGLNESGWRTDNQFYQWLNGAVFLTLLLVMLWPTWNRLKSGATLPAITLLSAILLFDLFSVNWQTNLFNQPPTWHTQEPAAVAAIQADGGTLDRVYNEFQLYDNYGVPFEQQDLWGASPLRPARYDQFLAPPMLIERAWWLLNVRYVITWRQELYAPATIIAQVQQGDAPVYVHRLTDVGPRARWVYRAEEANPATMVARLADPDFDWQNIALLETSLPPLAPDGLGTATVLEFRPGYLALQAKSDTPGLLLISEQAYPGWQATVNGQPAQLLTANYVLQAIALPAGTHRVELSFAPISVKIGLGITILTLMSVIGLWLYHRVKNKSTDYE